ncbi:MAG: DNA/RNA non-specific endonuclease, partial [Bdellovibrionales bacterium]
PLAYAKDIMYSKHWHGDRPQAEKSQDLFLIYDLFVSSFDSEKKFTRWVAYQMSPQFLWGSSKVVRSLKKDIYLSNYQNKNQVITFKDYKGASKFEYDKGHLVPLGSFKGSIFSYQLQYLTNIVPQSRNLNRGPWKFLESKIREFVKKGNELRVLVGTLYGQDNYGKPYKKTLPPWPEMQGKIRQIPSGFWKMISFKGAGEIKVCSFIMPQKVLSAKVPFTKYIVTKEVLKSYTGLRFFERVKTPIKEDCSFLN